MIKIMYNKDNQHIKMNEMNNNTNIYVKICKTNILR